MYFRKGSPIRRNTKGLSLNQKLIASRGMSSITHLVHWPTVGAVSEIHWRSTHLLALKSSTLSSFNKAGLRFNAPACIPRIHRIGWMSKRFSNIVLISQHILTQKSLITGQSKIQWKYVPSAVLHLTQYFESRGLNLFSFVWVIWSLCIILNCCSLALLVDKQPEEPDHTVQLYNRYREMVGFCRIW